MCVCVCVCLQEPDNGAEKMLSTLNHDPDDDDLTTGECFYHLPSSLMDHPCSLYSSKADSYSDLFEEVGKQSI